MEKAKEKYGSCKQLESACTQIALENFEACRKGNKNNKCSEERDLEIAECKYPEPKKPGKLRYSCDELKLRSSFLEMMMHSRYNKCLKSEK